MTAAVFLDLSNRLEELARVRPLLEQFAAAQALPDEVAAALRLALEEVLTNVIRHGCADGRTHQIRVQLARDGSQVTARVEDDGCPFDPLALPDPPVHLPVEERGVGGLGVWLTRHAMDGMEYRREGACNILVMRKTVPPV